MGHFKGFVYTSILISVATSILIRLHNIYSDYGCSIHSDLGYGVLSTICSGCYFLNSQIWVCYTLCILVRVATFVLISVVASILIRGHRGILISVATSILIGIATGILIRAARGIRIRVMWFNLSYRLLRLILFRIINCGSCILLQTGKGCSIYID